MSIGTGANQIAEHGRKYVRSEDLSLAVRVARATNRPLLLFGAPGSGKSTLAKNIAFDYDLRYYEHVVTARTTARDLLWSFDSVRRLGDAQVRREGLRDDDYVTPGVLWWAFDRADALGLSKSTEPCHDWNSVEKRRDRSAVVLIDEIDKADPDVPNSLLVPLAGRYFTITDLRDAKDVQEKSDPPCLIIITSNQERELPPAFVRRCVVHQVREHDEEDLRKIAELHVGTEVDYPLDDLIKALEKARAKADTDRRRRPSTAEFIDAIRACLGIGITSGGHAELKPVLKMIFNKETGSDSAQWSS